MLNVFLLVFIVALLVLLIFMQATGWPNSRSNDAEQLRRELLRELAGQRAESARSLHELKVELESLSGDGSGGKTGMLLKRVEEAVTLLQSIPVGVRKGNPKKNRDECRDEAPDSEEGGEAECERQAPGRNPLLLQRQYVLFPFDEPEGISPATPSADVPETGEYLSVPAADFDPDLDPPYDPDAMPDSGSQRNT